MKFTEKLSRWDEALQLGNASIGCLIWDDQPLKFSIDRAGLWDNTPTPQSQLPEFTYAHIIDCVKANDFQQVYDVFEACYYNPAPTKLTGGRIELDFGKKPDSIVYSLDRRAPIANIELKFDNETVNVKSFVSAVENIGLIYVNGNLPFESKVIRPEYSVAGKDKVDETLPYESVKALYYPEPQIIDDGSFKGFVQATNEDLKYSLLLSENRTENGILIAYTIEKSKLDFDLLSSLKDKLTDGLNIGFDALAKPHLEWWKEYYSMSSIKIEDEVLQELWDTSNYLLGCVSRKGEVPMPLQGVFTADEGNLPPWHGDYHNDLNTQQSYTGYLKANHLNQGESFIDFLVDLYPQFKKFSTEFFDCPDGLNIPGVMTIDGKALGGWAMYSYSITNAVWLWRIMEDYYAYTLDEKYFSEVLYPFGVGIEKSLYRWMVKDGDNGLRLAFSCSPEWNNNSSTACFMNDNTNYDLMLVRYFYDMLVKFAEKSGDTEGYSHYSDTLSRLPEFNIDETGFTIAKGVRLTESHRHHSHLMAIYPLRTFKWNDENKEVITKSIRSIEKMGHSLWNGYSYAWMALIYIVAHRPEAAAHMLKIFREVFCLPNGFHVNFDYKELGVGYWLGRPMTLEANMVAMDAVQEMLLYGEDGEIEVFPCITDSVAKKGAEFKTLRAKGAALVSSKIQNNTVEYIKITALKGGRFTIKLPREMTLSSQKGLISLKDDTCIYDFEENETLIIS